MDDAESGRRNPLGSAEAVAARREIPSQARAARAGVHMSEEREEFSTDAPLERILARDGFSPDLPRAGVGLGLRLLMFMFRGIRIGRLDVMLPNGALRSFEGAE